MTFEKPGLIPDLRLRLQAGEDLDEDDDDVDLDEEANTEGPASSGLRQRQLNRQEAEALGERAPLLRDQTRGKSVARLKRGKSVGKTGDATVFQAVLMVRSLSILVRSRY